MARNIEIKARLQEDQWAGMEATAARLGEGPAQLEQIDTFFQTHDGRLKLREFGDGTAELISYTRTNSAEPRLCRYQRFKVENPKQLKSMMEQSLGIQCVIEKQRLFYRVDQARVHLDEVKELGKFLEIEVVLRDEQLEEIGREIMDSLLDQFQLDSSCFEGRAYADLLMEQQATENQMTGQKDD